MASETAPTSDERGPGRPEVPAGPGSERQVRQELHPETKATFFSQPPADLFRLNSIWKYSSPPGRKGLVKHLPTPDVWLMALPPAQAPRRESFLHLSGQRGGRPGTLVLPTAQLSCASRAWFYLRPWDYHFSGYEVGKAALSFGQMAKYLTTERKY